MLDELEWCNEFRNQHDAVRRRSGRPTTFAMLVAAGLVVAAITAIAALRLPPGRQQPEAVQFPITETDRMRLFSGAALTLSPDGRFMVFPATDENGTRHYWLRALDSAEARPLPGTDAASVVPAFWSGDSRHVLFSTGLEGGELVSTLKTLDIQGGALHSVTEMPGVLNGASSNRDGQVVFGTNRNTPLFRVPITGGKAAPVTALAIGELRHAWPQFLPDGRHFLYFAGGTDASHTGAYVGSIDDPPDHQSHTRILATTSEAYYAPSRDERNGYLIFLSGTTLMARRFDPNRLTFAGEPFPIAQDIDVYPAAQYALFSVSAEGTLAYRIGSATQLSLSWFGEQGSYSGHLGDPAEYASPAISPDGTRVAAAIGPAGSRDVWLIDAQRDARTRLTFDPANDGTPVWSPDGRYIAFHTLRGGQAAVYIKPADGSAPERRIGDISGAPTDWSSDGRFLLVTARHGTGPGDVVAIPDPMNATATTPAIPVVATQFEEARAHFSPDGRWISYASGESGRLQVYVRSFSSDGRSIAVGPRTLVSKDGGTESQWSADGRRLIYQTNPNSARFESVTLDGSHDVRPGPPEPILDVSQMVIRNGWAYDAPRKRILLVTNQPTSASFMVVLNWKQRP